MSRSATLAARLYHRARSGLVPHEGFLEDALAAALEDPAAWARLRAIRAGHSPGWAALPKSAPTVHTQVTTGSGRADVVLQWPDGDKLVLELKAWLPPGQDQISRYLEGHPTASVSAIAQWSVDLQGERALPMITWGEIHAARWEGEPLAWTQLRHLIDAVGATMGNLDRKAIHGLIPTWSAWDTVEGWVRFALPEVQAQLARGGWVTVIQDTRNQQSMEQDNHRFGLWAWPAPWDLDAFGVFIGIYVGRDYLPVLDAGTPDLRFMVHLKPDGARAGSLWADASFRAAVATWTGLGGTVTRQASQDRWYLLDARSPLTDLADAPDQAAAFRSWMVDRARELVDLGIVARLART